MVDYEAVGRLISNGDLSEASRLLDVHIQVNPRDPQPWRYKAKVAYHSGNVMQEARCYEKAIELGSQHINIFRRLLAVYSNTRQLQKAIILKETMPEKFLEDETIIVGIAQIMLLQGKTDQAKKELDKLNPAGKEYLKAMHRFYAGVGDNERELEIAKRLLQQENNSNAFITLAHAKMKDKSYEDAIDYLKRAKNVDPSNTQTYCDVAEIRRRQGHIQTAINHIEKAKSINPRDPYPYIVEASIHKDLRDIGRHFVALSTAYLLQPSRKRTKQAMLIALKTPDQIIDSLEKTILFEEKNNYEMPNIDAANALLMLYDFNDDNNKMHSLVPKIFTMLINSPGFPENLDQLIADKPIYTFPGTLSDRMYIIKGAEHGERGITDNDIKAENIKNLVICESLRKIGERKRVVESVALIPNTSKGALYIMRTVKQPTLDKILMMRGHESMKKKAVMNAIDTIALIHAQVTKDVKNRRMSFKNLGSVNLPYLDHKQILNRRFRNRVKSRIEYAGYENELNEYCDRVVSLVEERKSPMVYDTFDTIATNFFANGVSFDNLAGGMGNVNFALSHFNAFPPLFELDIEDEIFERYASLYNKHCMEGRMVDFDDSLVMEDYKNNLIFNLSCLLGSFLNQGKKEFCVSIADRLEDLLDGEMRDAGKIMKEYIRPVVLG